MCECVYGHRKERQGRDRGWRRRADTAKMQTNELKNAGCIAVVGVGRAALPAIWHCRKLINAPVAGCREPKESDRERIREQERESINREKVRESGMIKEEETRAEREREREREGAVVCSSARVPFRQFFKIKSLSVLVKCISRLPRNSSLAGRSPLTRCTSTPATAVDAVGRAFARAIVPLFPRRSTCCV